LAGEVAIIVALAPLDALQVGKEAVAVLGLKVGDCVIVIVQFAGQLERIGDAGKVDLDEG
jgi:hypothetical protein